MKLKIGFFAYGPWSHFAFQKIVEDNEIIVANTIYIAPGGKQFKLKKRGDLLLAEVNDDEPVNRFKPSVDYLFKSLEKLRNINMIGVILTGMGKDGAQGLLNIKNIGAYTIAQDEESSVVFGMPKEAIKLGAECEVASLDDMSDKIVSCFNSHSKKCKKQAS